MWVLPGTRSSTFLSLEIAQGSTGILRNAGSLTRTSVRACSPWDPCSPRSGSIGKCSSWTLEKSVGGSAVVLGTAGRRSLMGRNIARCPLYGLGADATTPRMVNEGSAEWTISGTRRRRRSRRSREAPSTPVSALGSTARDTTVDRATTSNSTAGVSVTPLLYIDSGDGGPAEEEGIAAPAWIGGSSSEMSHLAIQGNGEAGATAQQSLPAETILPARRREPMTDDVEEQTDRETEQHTETPTEASMEGVHDNVNLRLERSAPGASPVGAGVGAKEEPWYPRDALADACRTEPRLVNAIRSFVRANPEATIIYLSYAGSRLYGTSTAASDLDMKGIYIPGPPSPKPGGTTAAATAAATVAAEGGNGGSRPLQQGRRAPREASSSVARSTSEGTSSAGTAGAEGGATPHGRVNGRNGTSSSSGFPGTTAPRPQTAVLRVDDEDWAFPAAERYSYSSANTSTTNTEDDIDLELVSLDRFFLSLQRAEISAIETLFSMENSAASLLSDPQLIPIIRREYPALVCANPTAWLGYANGHLAKFHKLCLQEAVARCALASAATAKRLRGTGSGGIGGGGDAEESGLLATDHGDFGGSGVTDGAAGVAGDGVGRASEESMLYVQSGTVPLPSSASPGTACVLGTEGSAVRGPEAGPHATGVFGGGAGAEDGTADSLEVTTSGVGEVDVRVGETSTPTAPMNENHGAGDILIEDVFIGGGITAGDAGDGAQQQAVAGGGSRVARGEVAGKGVAEAAIGEVDHRGEAETPKDTIDRAEKRVGKVISHAKRVIVEAEELLETGRLTLPLEAHHVAEIKTLKVDRMMQRRVEASLKADLRNLHKKAKESRLPSRVDRKHVIALRDDILALYESRGVPRRRKQRS